MSGKFEQLVQEYNQYLVENGFPPLSNLQPPAGVQNTAPNGAQTGTPTTSAIDPIEQEINQDPGVLAAKKRAIQQQEILLKKKANTFTNP